MCCACVTHWLGCPAMSNGNSNSQQLFFFFFLFHSVPTHVIPTPKGTRPVNGLSVCFKPDRRPSSIVRPSQ
ncbi:Uncharacterized protein APZ42_026524 [Daphnia magna]|uniref:Uncharacterized protein n=1 Tax=Daphnia magna TaxID=35525 RepID=A0A164S9F2_9CRUS|nr:Uncharacterized protein APZ42_026524 [Daphnia magna]